MKPAAPLFFGTLLAVFAAQPAQADRCDDIARQLARNVDGVKIGRTVAGIVYLTHPSARQASLGCSARNKTNEVFALFPGRKPSKEFFDFVASATAIVFTIPKSDALRGATRCANRIGFLRGKTIVTRYRKLDISCRGTAEGTSVTVSRELDS